MKNVFLILFNRFFPPLQVHCWGGLGSQLFAWAVIEELFITRPNRKLVLVLHTSGVTERSSEMDELSGYVEILKVTDYKPKIHAFHEKSESILRKYFEYSGVSLLSYLHVIVLSEDLSRIRPWTIHLRSHYSRRSLSMVACQNMFKRLSALELIDSNVYMEQRDFGIHYRLGDLLTLQNKTHVSPESLISIIELVAKENNFQGEKISVHSDSPDIAIRKIFSLEENYTLLKPHLNPWATLSNLIQYRMLIVTNSKIGIWAIIFKVSMGLEGVICAPQDMRQDLKLILGKEFDIANISFY